jgi:hypothetical protein
MTKNQLISDIILRVTKGLPSDDLELEPSQVAFWINIVSDLVVKEYLDAKLADGKAIDSFFIKQESCKPLNNEADPCIDDDKERIYVRLKQEPMDLYMDKAIVLMKTNEGSYIYKADLSTIDQIGLLEFAKPSTNNLVYYRDGKTKVVIEGIPRSLMSIVEIIVWYVPKQDIECLADTDEVAIPNELIGLVQEGVEDLARRQLFGVQDINNNGVDETAQNG